MPRPRRLHWFHLIAYSAAAALLAFACTGASTVLVGGADASADGSGGRPDAAVANEKMLPPTSTGNALVDRLGAAASKCGPQSSLTVPGGWQLVAIGDKGCMVHAPPGWKVIGFGTPTVSVFRDDAAREGFFGLAGAAQTATCTPPAVRDGVLQGFVANNYDSVDVLWHAEANEAFGGSTWPIGHTVFSMKRAGAPLLGYLWLLTTQTVVACDVVGLGFWLPQDAIETDTCTLTQTFNSIRCPSGGGEEKDGG